MSMISVFGRRFPSVLAKKNHSGLRSYVGPTVRSYGTLITLLQLSYSMGMLLYCTEDPTMGRLSYGTFIALP